MNWAEAHRIAMVAAAHAHRDFSVDLDHSVDVFGVIEEAEVLLAFEPFPNLSGAYLLEQGAPPAIVVNSNHPLARQRYTAAHEFGHHRLDHGSSVDPAVEPLLRWGSGPPSDTEKVAEAFAAWFLMPRPLVARALASLGLERPTQPNDVYQLSLRLGTSYEATARHLPNVRLANAASVRSWLRTPPAEIKRTTAGEWVPPDLHNDVFSLGAGSDGTVVDVRPGDRLLVRLAETPSSGFTWGSIELPPGLELLGDEYTDVAEDEVAGAAALRVFAVGVSAAAGNGSGPLQLIKARPWDITDRAGTFSAEVRVVRPRRGIDESYFRSAA